MTPVRGPLKNALRRTSPASIERMWGRIEARGRHRRHAPRGRGWALMAAAIVLSSMVFAAARLRAPHQAIAEYRGPVLETTGAILGVIPSSREEQRLALNDGSTLTLAPGASVEPLRNTESAVVLMQAQGTVSYDIFPGGTRSWTIECGAVAVEVVGTSFRIDRSEARVRVEVTRGVVLVRGEGVPDHVVKLPAGASIEVATRREGVLPTPAPLERAVDAPPLISPPKAPIETTPASPAASSKRSSPPATWKQLAADGDNERAYAELGHDGIAETAKSASVQDLFALADIARLSGHAAEAAPLLQRIVTEHAADGRAPLAALSLGRIELRSLANPGAAAQALEKAIVLGVPAGLLEDTYGLLIESLSRAGNATSARNAYERYLARFPDGARLAEVRRWIHEP